MRALTTTVREHFGELAEQISAGAEAPLRDLEKLVGGTAAGGRPEDVAWLRLGLAQLAGYDLRPDITNALLALDSVLEGTQIQLDAARARRMREETRRTLKERVVELLRGQAALRPKDLVDSCGSDAYQVSRALRELREAGLIELADPPEASRALFLLDPDVDMGTKVGWGLITFGGWCAAVAGLIAWCKYLIDERR